MAVQKKYPECPLYDHRNCRECENPKVCAIVREDRQCLRKLKQVPDGEAAQVSAP